MRNRGFTLAETLVYLGLAALLLSVVLGLYTSSTKFTRITSIQNELKQETTIINQRLGKSLMRSGQDGVYVSQDTSHLVVQEIVAADVDGNSVWDSKCTLYWLSGDRLMTGTYPVTGSPQFWDQPGLDAALQWLSDNKKQKVLSHLVSGFVLAQDKNNKQELQITITLRKDVNSDRWLSQKTSKTFFLTSETEL